MSGVGALSFSAPASFAPAAPQAGPLYFTSPGLAQLSQAESSGNPTATNPTSTASGLYGFTNPTWLQYAPLAGVDTSLYPTAASAPSTLQMQVAGVTPASNWLCSGCDAKISAAVAADPSLVSTSPISNNSSTLGGLWNSLSNLNSSAGNIISNPLGTTGGPSTTDPSGNGSGIFAGLESWLSSIASNVVLAVLALIILLVALWPHIRDNAGKVATAVGE